MRPKIGDLIYIETQLYLSHGIDDFIGGLCEVINVYDEENDACYIEVKEDPGAQYNWAYLEPMQKDLKKEFGDKRGYHKPDLRDEFNTFY